MKKTVLLCLFSLIPLSAWSQHPADYIKWDGGDSGQKFYDAYKTWQQGQPLYSNHPEDENFFISRVRFKPRFRNAQTQVDKTLTEDRDKNVFNWLPIGAVADHQDNALPSGIFDSDVFSMWSYITHWGNWTAPMVRMPGSFSDVVHKNGVSTSTVASIPWAFSITSGSDWDSLFQSLINGGADKFVNYLNYYGIDGWGMNSEFRSYNGFANKLQNFMVDVYDHAVTQNKLPSYSAAWYTLVNNSGQVTAAYDGLSDGNVEWYHHNSKAASNYVFGNYNWNSSELQNNDQLTAQLGRNPKEIYAGMNIQGSQGKNWKSLQNYKTSIGLWGAHNMNIFFEGRNELGSSDEAKQATYQTRIERFFGNGAQNPAKVLPIQNVLSTSAEVLKSFHGVSALATAKSVLSWDLGKEAFYSYFNLGNGKFFNIDGQKAYDGEWYNIAMQDYLPTWRYWFSTSFLGSDVPDSGLSARFSWDDAWFGGSSLQIRGTTPSEYLQLFKTKFNLKQGDKITIRYKVLSGSANLSLIGSAEGSENSAQEVSIFDSSDIVNGEWQEATITVRSSGRHSFNFVDKTLAAISLKFTDADNLNMLLGEFSIKRGEYEKPQTPIILDDLCSVLKYSYKGVDAKINFKMPTPSGKSETDRLYNDDVKTSFFKVYSMQEGGNPMFVGATTSWAALVFNAPISSDKAKKIKFGVSAVGLDGVTESDIAWGKEFDTPTVTIVDDIEVDKSTIKPEQNFTVRFLDTNHPAATSWTILKNGTTEEVATMSGTKSFTTKLSDIGIYDLKLIYGGKETLYPGFIQISSEAVGAVPEIKTLTFNGNNIDNNASVKADVNKDNTIEYTTARKSDGIVSRGLNLKEGPMGIRPASVGISRNNQSWTMSFWVKFFRFNGTTHMLNIRDAGEAWPANTWGFVWSQYYPNTGTYELFLRSGRRNGGYGRKYEHLNLKTGSWTNMTYVYSFKDGKYDIKLYINGKYVPSTKWQSDAKDAKWQNGDGNGFEYMYPWKANSMIMFGGNAKNDRAGVDGVVDDVKFFDKALSADEIAKNVFSEAKDADSLVGYWDFEGDVSSDATIQSVSTKGNGVMVWGKLEAVDGIEGATTIKPIEPSFEAGSPFVSGKNFVVTTLPTWTFPKAHLTDANGNDTQGSAKVSYDTNGVFTGTLTLSNSWGKDVRTITAINVGKATGVEITDAVSLQAFPNPFVETVNIRFPEAGNYVATIYDVNGRVVSSKIVTAVAGSVYTINVNATKGLYLLRVTTKSGKLLRTLKLLNK